MTEAFKTEKEMAAVVVTWFQEHRWDVSQEVESPDSSAVADIVATLGTIVCVCEAKLKLSFDVAAQIDGWKNLAHWRYVAVPKAKVESDGRRLAMSYLRERGVGVMICHPGGRGFDPRVEVRHHPHLFRRADAAALRAKLRPEHKTFAKAGSAHGRHWSDFKETSRSVHRFVAEHPGCSVGDLVAAIKHHYPHDRSARACLVHWGDRGSIDGVKVVRVGGKVTFQPTMEFGLEPCDNCQTPSILRAPDGHMRVCKSCKELLGFLKDSQ